MAGMIVFLAAAFARQPLFPFGVLARPRVYPARVYGLCLAAAIICGATIPFLFHAVSRDDVDVAIAGALVLLGAPIIRDWLLGPAGRAMIGEDDDSWEGDAD